MNKTLLIAIALSCLMAPVFSTAAATYQDVSDARTANGCTGINPICPTSDTLCATDAATIFAIYTSSSDCTAYATAISGNAWDYDTTMSNNLDSNYSPCYTALTAASTTSKFAIEWQKCILNALDGATALAPALTNTAFQACLGTTNSIASNLYIPPCTNKASDACATESAAITTALTGTANCSALYTSGTPPTWSFPSNIDDITVDCLNTAYAAGANTDKETLGYIGAIQDCLNVGTGSAATAISAATLTKLNSFDNFLTCRKTNGCAEWADIDNLETGPTCLTSDSNCASDATAMSTAAATPCSSYNTAASTSGNAWPTSYLTCIDAIFNPGSAYTSTVYQSYAACALACAVDHTQTTTTFTRTPTYDQFGSCRHTNGCGADSTNSAYEVHPLQTAVPADATTSWTALSALTWSGCANYTNFPSTGANSTSVSNDFITCIQTVYASSNFQSSAPWAQSYAACVLACLEDHTQTTAQYSPVTYGDFGTCASNNGCAITSSVSGPSCPANATDCNANAVTISGSDSCLSTITGGSGSTKFSPADITCINSVYPSNYNDEFTKAWASCVQNCVNSGSSATVSTSTSRTYGQEATCRTANSCSGDLTCASSDTACAADLTAISTAVGTATQCGSNFGAYTTNTALTSSSSTAQTDDYISCINTIFGGAQTYTSVAGQYYASCRIQCLYTDSPSLSASSGNGGQTGTTSSSSTTTSSSSGIFTVVSYVAMIVLGLIAFI